MSTVAATSSSADWGDWRWHLKHRITIDTLADYFPGLSADELRLAREYDNEFRFAITPYAASLIEHDSNRRPLDNDPIWLQHRFYNYSPRTAAADYDRVTLNWETPGELPTHVLHHKYPDRAALRVVDSCLMYCNYCYLANRVLDRSVKTGPMTSRETWSATLAYLRDHPELSDILISGGEPLLLPTSRLRSVLEDLRSIESIKTIRLNTRALSHLPFRIDDEIAAFFRDLELTALEVHVVHPREITSEFDAALERLDRSGYRPLVLWRAPLLRAINDSVEVLEDLLRQLYERRIVPYRLFHYAPFSPARSLLATSVRAGVALLLALRRRIPGIAFPAYTLFHPTGKHDVPLELTGTDEFRYYDAEQPSVRFKNWRGSWETYPDIRDDHAAEVET